MIIIFSNLSDSSTLEVCKWLDFYEQDYKLVYDIDFFNHFHAQGVNHSDFLVFLKNLLVLRL